MARGMLEAEKSLKELEKEITCSICQEHYTQPKVLPCLHYYCKQCILTLSLIRGKDKPFCCPECRKEAILPGGNEDNLQTAFFVNRFKALYDQQERALSKEEVKCEMCSTSQVKAEAFCRQCGMFVCGECIKSHQRMKVVFDGHEILSLDEVKKARAKDVLTQNPPAKKCQLHDDLLTIFCFDCNHSICRDCTVKDHRDHDFEFNLVAAVKMRKELMESLKPMREMAVCLSIAVEDIQTTEHLLAAQGESVANKIETFFDEFHIIIERRKQKLLMEAERKVSEKMANLQGQKKNMSISGAEVQSIVDYTEQCVKHCSDDEVMCVHAEIGSRIKHEIEEHKSGRNLTPEEEVDVGVEIMCAEALEHLFQTQAKITQLPVSLVINRISSKAEVNHLSEVILYISKLCDNKQTRRALYIDCHLKSLLNASPITTNIKDIGADQYQVQFTPILRGRHELTVSVDGRQVAGGPFPVFVSVPPTQLDQPVKVWGGITRPRGITVNTAGEIIVTERRGDVVVLNKEGRRLRCINCSEHLFKYSPGVAVDSDDNIYFTGLWTRQIFKSDKNCSKVQEYKVQQVEGPGHYGVAVVGDEVMVTERGNGGRIMVYDRELKYVRQIVSADKSSFRLLSSDSQQNVYVSDHRNSSVQVFSNDGEFLRSFGCDGNGVARLKSPLGVCVAGQYVYVTDKGIYKIVVFTTEGDYVTSFGSESCDVYVDQDGFVYVSDDVSSKIFIY